MPNFSNLKIERKNILDLLILVTAITILVNFFTNGTSWAFNYITLGSIRTMTFLWILLIFLIITIIIWRISKSPLFSFQFKKTLPLIFIYDKKNKNLLGINDFNSPHYNARSAFGELLKVNEDFKKSLPSIENGGIGDDLFRNILNDIFEYSLLATISSNFFGPWKIENVQKYFGVTTHSLVNGGKEIEYNDLPDKLRNENIILKTFAERFKNDQSISGLAWVNLSLPPKTNLTYENKILSYKNKYINFNIKLSGFGSMVGAPIALLNNIEKQQERFITIMFNPLISVKITPYLALSSQSELYEDWAMQFIERIENRIITNEKEYAKRIKEDNNDLQ